MRDSEGEKPRTNGTVSKIANSLAQKSSPTSRPCVTILPCFHHTKYSKIGADHSGFLNIVLAAIRHHFWRYWWLLWNTKKREMTGDHQKKASIRSHQLASVLSQLRHIHRIKIYMGILNAYAPVAWTVITLILLTSLYIPSQKIVIFTDHLTRWHLTTILSQKPVDKNRKSKLSFFQFPQQMQENLQSLYSWIQGRLD